MKKSDNRASMLRRLIPNIEIQMAHRTCHAHPKLSEPVRDASLVVDERPIHI
jgi:hypothetical protein